MPVRKHLTPALPRAVSTAAASSKSMTLTSISSPATQTLASAFPVAEEPLFVTEDGTYNEWDTACNQLIDWACHPSELECEGIQPPDNELICRAYKFARNAQRIGATSPTGVYPDPNGGIVFELRQETGALRIHFWDDGPAEFLRFEGTRLVERRPLE